MRQCRTGRHSAALHGSNSTRTRCARLIRLGLEITLNITSGWNVGGPEVTPEQSSKLLTWSRTRVHRGTLTAVQLPSPPKTNGFYRQIAVLAYPLHSGAELHSLPGLRERSASVETGFSMPSSDWMLTPNGHPKRSGGLARPIRNDLEQGYGKAPFHRAESPQLTDAALDEVKDVTQFVSRDGKLKWSAPGGEWEILRIGYTDSDARVSTASGAWQGRAMDYLSKPAFDAYWDHTVEPLLVACQAIPQLEVSCRR